jgi:regulator of chromosome condensation
MYEMQQCPPENFVAQMAFSMLNSFLLTTDGRVFSWGAFTTCLGRQIITDKEEEQSTVEELVDEVRFPVYNAESIPITAIAAGKQHVLALDTKGRVFVWGQNNFG